MNVHCNIQLIGGLGKIRLFFILFFLVACQADKEDVSVFITDVKLSQQAKIKPIPRIKSYETFLYSASDLRDPFTEAVIDSQLKGSDNNIYPDAGRKKEDLEEYNLDALRMVGTLQQEQLWALIQTPIGEVHRVQTGSYMGKNEGEIINISENDLVLNEIVPNDEGDGFIKRESSLSLSDAN